MKSGVARLANRAVLLVLLCGIFGAAARAEDGDIKALRQELKQLRQTVERLDVRVQTLEQQRSEQAVAGSTPGSSNEVAEPSTPQPAPGRRPDTSLAEHWHSLKRGMSVQEVQNLLGRPTRTVKLTGKTIWYYVYPEFGNGSVVFDSDDNVMDWQTPPFGAWPW